MAKFSPRTNDSIRSHIKTVLLVQRMQEFALGSPDDKDYKPMTASQVRAAIALLDRTVPTLVATTIDDARDTSDDVYAAVAAAQEHMRRLREDDPSVRVSGLN